jgi:hypothetical protein
LESSTKNNKNVKRKKSKSGNLKFLKILIAPLIIAIFVLIYFMYFQPGYKILYQDSENETIFLSLYVKDTTGDNLIEINDKLYFKYKDTYSNFSFNYFDDKDAASTIYLIMVNDTGEVRKKALEHNIAVFLKNKDHNCLLKKGKDVPVSLKCY